MMLLFVVIYFNVAILYRYVTPHTLQNYALHTLLFTPDLHVYVVIGSVNTYIHVCNRDIFVGYNIFE
jgi:hypothetical protein